MRNEYIKQKIEQHERELAKWKRTKHLDETGEILYIAKIFEEGTMRAVHINENRLNALYKGDINLKSNVELKILREGTKLVGIIKDNETGKIMGQGTVPIADVLVTDYSNLLGVVEARARIDMYKRFIANIVAREVDK